MGLQSTIKALSDPIRREILEMLKAGRMAAGEIAEHFSVSGAAVSKHLSVLRDADLIRDAREGKFIYYELNTSVLEEVMLRLFWMSLVAFLLWKLFAKNEEKPTVAILMIANVVAAILFAAGHLPATLMMIGSSPMVLIRCFLLNGGFGLLFGYLYRKHGLRYAMLAHGGCHIVSKLIWILFI